MTSGLDPRVRLRVAAESAAGPRVFVLATDVLALIGAGATPGPAVPAPRRPESEQDVGPQVNLRADREGATRLARAAWDSCPERVAGHGRWQDAPGGLREQQVDAAQRALELLAGLREPEGGEGDPDLPSVAVDPEQPPF